MSELYAEIYDFVKRVPRGRVTSYGAIARALGRPRASRVVGMAMRACHSPDVPCHRVVHGDGRLSEVFGAGGSAWQRTLLCAEGVGFLPDGRVDMERYSL